MGLDKDDAIIKRRLAQKMDFVIEDLATMLEPTTAQLTAWFKQNEQRFMLPPRASFRLLYFSPDRRGKRAREDALQAMARLAREPANSPIAASLADPFMFQSAYGDRTPEQLSKLFGISFAKALFNLKPGPWQGPIKSGYGWHLVWMNSDRVPVACQIFRRSNPLLRPHGCRSSKTVFGIRLTKPCEPTTRLCFPRSMPHLCPRSLARCRMPRRWQPFVRCVIRNEKTDTHAFAGSAGPFRSCFSDPALPETC